MVTRTIDEGLRPYQIGPQTENPSPEKEQVAGRTGQDTRLSAALLSKLERAKLYPTLPTLLRIAMVFSVGLDYFFTDERKRHIVSVVRKNEHITLLERPGAGEVAYHFASLDFKSNERKTSAYIANSESVAEEKLKPHQHPGLEFLHVLKGTLGLRIGIQR